MSIRALVVVVLSGAVSLAHAASADDDHVIVARASVEVPGRGLFELLRIQLVGRARVTSGPELVGASRDLRHDEAVALLRGSRGATLVVYSEPLGDGKTLLVVVGPSAPPGVPVSVRSYRVPGGEQAETQRTMALKIASVLDLVAAEAFDGLEVPSAPGLAERPGSGGVRPPEARPGPTLALFARGGLSGGERGLDGSGELRLSWRRLGHLAPVLAVGLGTGDRWTDTAGEVETRAWNVDLGVHAGLLGPFGASLLVGVQGLSAEGTTAAGATGQASEARAELRLAVDAAWWLSGWRIAAELGADLRPAARDFAVNQVVFATPERVHAYLGIGLGKALW